jgi:hypothetical protein
MHSRSQAWYAKKALEIQARGGRKFWFGKAPARIRWLQRKRVESHQIRGITGGKLPSRSDPQPQTYTRPLDFGDVPEAELPEDVRQNPGWLKACEWFRQQQNLRGIRLRQSKRCEKEANDYFNIMVYEEVTRTSIKQISADTSSPIGMNLLYRVSLGEHDTT